jgi:hypothetical protein
MRDLGGRLFIGLAAVAAGIMAVGYAFIFRGVAAPSGAIGTIEVPAAGQVVATTLDDGRPVFVAAAGATVWVLDARQPHDPGELDALVGWCQRDQAFVGTRPTSVFAVDGSSLRGPGTVGMSAHATTPVTDDPSRIRVEAQTSVRPVAAEERQISYSCGPADWVVHRALPDEIFDPSIAVEGEPPGWTWLEGTLLPIGNQALLCDGLDAVDCPTGAVANGIDPATLPPGGLAGLFLGRVHDGTIEGLILAPKP